MAKKETTSDKLKDLFASHGGGAEKDWKRLSKKNNTEGQPVRIFENKNIGVTLEVVELGAGQFKARQLTSAANANFAAPTAVPTTAIVLQPVIDTNQARNEAADSVIETLDEEDENPMLKQAGKALANRFVFAIGGGDLTSGLQDGLYAEISLKGRDYDQHLEHVISHLLPKGHGGEVTELTFDFSNYRDPVKLVSDMHACGFIWDAQYQAEMDVMSGTKHLPALSAVFGAVPVVKAPVASPKHK